MKVVAGLNWHRNCLPLSDARRPVFLSPLHPSFASSRSPLQRIRLLRWLPLVAFGLRAFSLFSQLGLPAEAAMAQSSL